MTLIIKKENIERLLVLNIGRFLKDSIRPPPPPPLTIYKENLKKLLNNQRGKRALTSDGSMFGSILVNT